MGLDYYAVLQVTRNSEDAQIKKAYRKLALKNHPLKSSEPSAPETFRQIAEAYDVLSDPVKRGIYDKFGEEGLKGGIPLEFGSQTPWTTGYVFHGNPEKVFHEFFGGDNPFSEFFDAEGSDIDLNFGGLRGRGVQKQDPPIERDLYLSLEDLFFGCTKKIKISRRVLNEDKYSSTIKDKILTIDVRPGWRQGTRITFEKEGDQGPNIIPADIIFIVKEKLHPRFRRELDNLFFVYPIPLGKALTCCTVEVKTLDDRLLNIPINDIVQPETVAGVRSQELGALSSGSQLNSLASCKALGRSTLLALIHALLRRERSRSHSILGWKDILLSRPSFTAAGHNSPRTLSTVYLISALIQDRNKMSETCIRWPRRLDGPSLVLGSQSLLLEKKQPCLSLSFSLA